jgi:hypothetical protein
MSTLLTSPAATRCRKAEYGTELVCDFDELVVSHRRNPNMATQTTIQISEERPNGFPSDGKPGGRESPEPFLFDRDRSSPPRGNAAQPDPIRQTADDTAGNRRPTDGCCDS